MQTDIFKKYDKPQKTKAFKDKLIKIRGHKCERCWNYFDELVEIDGHYVCPRCHEVIKDVE